MGSIGVPEAGVVVDLARDSSSLAYMASSLTILPVTTTASAAAPRQYQGGSRYTAKRRPGSGRSAESIDEMLANVSAATAAHARDRWPHAASNDEEQQQTEQQGEKN
jgi:hypothetical protein